MNELIGHYSLLAAVVVAGFTIVTSLGAARLGTPKLHQLTRWGMGLLAVAFAIASAALANALVTSDFSILYVASYTERTLPLGYKLSAFWAGQEGSLLFWGLTLAIMVAIFAFVRRRDESRQHAIALLVLAAITGFFAAMLTFADADKLPFSPLRPIPEDGMGLNPMLQNFGMIAHPPTLFIGYAGFTIPFALMIGALACGKLDTWIGVARRWVLVSWVFLGVGIVLGAQWAYVELGWGGYWAWDPVENASLLPWLTGTALLHSIVVQQHRSMFKLWNVALAAGTFLLCIFGTYITRSGVIQSVHAFAPSLIATFFLSLLIISLLTCIALSIFRWRSFKAEGQMQGLISREGAVLFGNALLVFMTLMTLVGTVSPLASEMFGGVTATETFYNRRVLPLAVLMLLLMGVAPLLPYGSVDLRALRRKLRIPLVISVVAAVIAVVVTGFSLWTLLTTFAVTLTVCGTLGDYISVALGRWRRGEGTLPGSLFAVLDANHRRYGGHLAHLGIAMVAIGVLGSGLYGQKQSFELSAGDSARIGSYSLRLDTVNEIEGANFTGMEAVITLTDRHGQERLLKPQLRRYTKSKQGANAEVAFLTNLREDIYVSTLGFGSESSATVQVMVNPLVLWIWIGGIAMTVGGLWAMLPMLVHLRSKRGTATITNQQTVTQGA